MINKIVGSRNDRFVKKYNQRVDEINAVERQGPEVVRRRVPREGGHEFRARFDKGESRRRADDRRVRGGPRGDGSRVGIRAVFNPEFKFDPTALPRDAGSLRAHKGGDGGPAGDVPRTFKPSLSAHRLQVSGGRVEYGCSYL
jgi:hypothetical protein